MQQQMDNPLGFNKNIVVSIIIEIMKAKMMFQEHWVEGVLPGLKRKYGPTCSPTCN